MRKKDIPLIIVIAFFSFIVALLVSNFVFNSSGSRQLQSASVKPISPEFNDPDKKFFNDQSTNPTQKIQIGENSNEKPFGQ